MNEEKVLLHATVCYLIKDNKVLLALKTKKIGEGCWNGYGGGIEEKESVIEAAVRELHEESGVVAIPEYLEKIAVVDFHNTKSDGSTFICRVHFFKVFKWTGDPQESEEMITPTWFEINNLPVEKMMPADVYWLPLALGGKKIIGKAHYGPFQKKLMSDVVLEEVVQFPY